MLSDRFYANLAFSPDGKRLVFVADDGRDPRTQAEKDNNVRIVREDQGEIYEGYGNAQIWVADLLETPGEVAASQVTRLTDDEFWYGDPQWSPDGKSIVVHANRTDDQESVTYSINKNYDLWKIDLAIARAKAIDDRTGAGSLAPVLARRQACRLSQQSAQRAACRRVQCFGRGPLRGGSEQSRDLCGP